MRKLSFILACAVISVTANSQVLSTFRWKDVRIPIDSLIPQHLFVIDSQHLVFIARKDSFYINDHNFFQDDIRHFWFESSDGGKSWNNRIDTNSNLFGGSTNPF